MWNIVRCRYKNVNTSWSFRKICPSQILTFNFTIYGHQAEGSMLFTKFLVTVHKYVLPEKKMVTVVSGKVQEAQPFSIKDNWMLERHGGIPREWRILLIFKKKYTRKFISLCHCDLPYSALFQQDAVFPAIFCDIVQALFERYPMCHTFIFLQKLYLLLFT